MAIAGVPRWEKMLQRKRPRPGTPKAKSISLSASNLWRCSAVSSESMATSRSWAEGGVLPSA
jgi:hypothetical protein